MSLPSSLTEWLADPSALGYPPSPTVKPISAEKPLDFIWIKGSGVFLVQLSPFAWFVPIGDAWIWGTN